MFNPDEPGLQDNFNFDRAAKALIALAIGLGVLLAVCLIAAMK